jgi:hypothetical protein
LYKTICKCAVWQGGDGFLGTLCWSKHICYIPFCTVIANDNNKLKKFWKYIFNAVFHAGSEYVISFYVRSLVNVLYGRMGDRILEILYWENFGNMSKWDIMTTLTYELYVWKNKQFQMIFFVYKWITYKKIYIVFLGHYAEANIYSFMMKYNKW